MKIAFVDYVCDPAKPGQTGLSDLVWDMASHLARKGEEVHIVAPYTVNTFPASAVHVHRFRLPPIGYRNIAGHILIILRAYQELCRLGALDIVHTPEYASSAIISSISRDMRVVFTEPGNIYDRLANGNPYDWITTQAYKAAARVTARNCAHCIATSEMMKNWWHWTGVSANRMTLIPLGIDTSLFNRVENARAQLGWPNDRKIVLYAARLSRENGADVTLRAFAQLQQELPDIELHILGDGPEKAALHNLADQLQIGHSIVWHGWVDFQRLPVYYSAANVLAFSGFSGGTPRVILQAMACGTVVVASSIGGIVDHITDQQTGLLFTPGRDQDLSTQLKAVLTNTALSERLGYSGKAYVDDNVSWDILVRRIREVYVKVLVADARKPADTSVARIGHDKV